MSRYGIVCRKSLLGGPSIDFKIHRGEEGWSPGRAGGL